MRLIFLRHGLAEGHFSHDQDRDFERELTPEGIKRLHKSFKIYKKIQPQIHVIFSSPLARAIQTAEIFWSYYRQSDLEMMVAQKRGFRHAR